MGKIRKIVSLLLVLGMALGLAGTGVASSFTDSAAIHHTDAVELMSGIGIIVGYTDGSFKPDKVLNRAEAAKIITYICIGKASADSLKVSSSMFEDVPADNWAAGYISYCANQGIIVGDGHGKFMPEKQLTGYAFAKMLLVALGYGVNDEFIGQEWESNVATYASSRYADIFKGNYAINGSAGVTREEACLYAYNALFAEKVNYYNLVGDYITGSIFGVGGLGTLADGYGLVHCQGVVEYSNGAYRITGTDGSYPLSGYTGDPGDIGRSIEVWCQKGTLGAYTPVTAVTYTDTVLATRYDGSREDDWTKRSSGSYIARTDSTVSYYVNGAYSGDSAPEYGKGDKVVVLDSDGNGRIDRVMVTTYAASAVGGRGVTTQAIGGSSFVSIQGVGPTGIGNDNFDNGVEASRAIGYADLKVGDVTYYNYNYATDCYYFYKAATIKGQKTSQSMGTGEASISFGGAAGMTDSGIPFRSSDYGTGVSNMEFNTDTTAFLDAGGYIIAYTGGSTTSLEYAVLLDAVKVQGSGLSGSTYLEALLLFPNGRTEVVKVASITSGRDVYTANSKFPTTSIANMPGYSSLVRTFYTYAVVNGQYALTDAGAAVGGSQINGGMVVFDGYNTANSATVFLVGYRDSTGQYAYKTYTGYANVPSSSVGSAVTTRVISERGIAKYVYIDAYNDVNFGSVVRYAYISNSTPSRYATGTVQYDVYSAVVDGKASNVSIWVTNTASVIPTVGLYEVVYDQSGFATLSSPVYNTLLHNYNAAPSVISGGTMIVGGASYAYTNATVTYIVSADGSVRVGRPEDIATGSVIQTSVKVQGTSAVQSQIAEEIYVRYY